MSVNKINVHNRTRRDKTCLVSTFQLPKIVHKNVDRAFWLHSNVILFMIYDYTMDNLHPFIKR
jgi:hypothetical protein